MSVCPSTWNSSAPTGQILVKFDISVFFYHVLGKLDFHYNLTRITGTVHEVQYTFLIITPAMLIGMRNVSDKSCRENQKTNFILYYFAKILTFLDCVKKIL